MTAVYPGVCGPFVALLRWLFVRVLLVAACCFLFRLVRSGCVRSGSDRNQAGRQGI